MPRQQQEERRPLQVDRIKIVTKAAILVVIDGREVWIPKSQVHEGNEIDPTDEPTEIHVAPWFIKKEGLED